MYHHFVSVSSNTMSYKKKSVGTHAEVFDNIPNFGGFGLLKM